MTTQLITKESEAHVPASEQGMRSIPGDYICGSKGSRISLHLQKRISINPKNPALQRSRYPVAGYRSESEARQELR